MLAYSENIGKLPAWGSSWLGFRIPFMILLDKALPLLKSVAFHVPQDQQEKIMDTCMDAVDTQHL